MRALILLLLAMPAFGQTYSPACLPRATPPALDTPFPTSSAAHVSWNTVGVCVRWTCFDTGAVSDVAYCGTWAEQAKVGARIQTIQKATDPLKSLQTAGTRFKIVPLSDPSMAGMPK